MRIQSLALLSFLLAAQVLLVEDKKERGRKKGHSLGRTRLAKGGFLTPDQAECRWAVVEDSNGARLKVECTRVENQFSCYFAGNPHSCPDFANKKRVYWKQIGRNLAQQTNICERSQTVLKTRLCGKKFPEAYLKMMNSTLIKTKESTEKFIQQTVITEAKTMSTTTTPKPAMVIETKETTPAKAQQQTMSANGPECEQDPDVQYQRKLAGDYCGDSWASFCQFFLTMLQDKPC
ncbi:fibroblast growth factor-binding protein 1 [Trichechus manatus latirostris]|uniref:Fibroblast growth factor-binding protein 1 n=1 Tax=Trichechus manatus latirostris TaxID=127582 RepID=A0A2Y9DJ63_TRIMA|nr:fibroblast growth factor-binding protein 1 [Trichechus manatus latirostris]